VPTAPRISGEGGVSISATTTVRCIRWMVGVKRRTDGECIYAAPMVRRASQRPHHPIDNAQICLLPAYIYYRSTIELQK